jgi:ribosome modulation factor
MERRVLISWWQQFRRATCRGYWRGLRGFLQSGHICCSRSTTTRKLWFSSPQLLQHLSPSAAVFVVACIFILARTRVASSRLVIPSGHHHHLYMFLPALQAGV